MATIKYKGRTLEVLAGQTITLHTTKEKFTEDIIIDGSGSVRNCFIPHVYYDELPADAVDGSLAVVESDSIKGSWQFDCSTELNFDSLRLHSIPSSVTANVYVSFQGYVGNFGFLDGLKFVCKNGNISLFATTSFGEMAIYYDDMWDDVFSPFEFYGDVIGIEASDGYYSIDSPFTINEFKAWMKSSAERLSGGHTLYSRINGEWVEEGETNISADSPLPIEVSTEEEMTAILTKATTSSVGSVYKYTGETTKTYENGSLYIIAEEGT